VISTRAWSRDLSELTLAQAVAVRDSRLAEPVPTGAEGTWELRTGSMIGVAFGEDWELRVVPKLDVPKLMFLLVYAVDTTGWQRSKALFEEADDVITALATGFAVLASSALDRGLLRGYVWREDALPVVRGRIQFGTQIARGGGLPLPVHLAYEDFTEDILENRLLRTATELLLRLPRVPADARRQLRRIRSILEQVEPLREWRRVEAPKPTRLNASYMPALRLAELILSSASLSTSVGEISSTTFVFDMNKVFEDFVTAAFRRAMRPYGGIVADQEKEHSLDVAGRLRLKPDLVWRVGSAPRAVLDAKYKEIDLGVMRHPDAYQMLAYCTAYGLPRGYLVYAKDSGAEPRMHMIRNSGHEIEVVTLDVEKEPEDLLSDVNALAERVARRSTSPKALAA